MPVISSLCDTDFYKFTQGQLVFHKFPSAIVNLEFKCRNNGIDLTPYKEEIELEIKNLCGLHLTDTELRYLGNIKVLSPDYIHFLQTFHLSEDFIKVSIDSGELTIKICGPWLQVIYFEVPVLAIVNEIYFRHKTSSIPEEAYDRLMEKLILVMSTELKFADFGTRRRFSGEWQDIVIKMAKDIVPHNLLGTSNVMLAMKHDIKQIGTMAHELICGCQAFVHPRDSQKFALQTWADEFRGELGIALSDTLGFDAFLQDFDLYFAKLYDGIRQDSGDPAWVAEKLIQHYGKLGIDPKTKSIVFSDGLTIEKALELEKVFGGRIKTSYGIGTHLTNDVGLSPLQIVIKLVRCNGLPVCKLSDSAGKTMCKDESYMEYLRGAFKV